MYVHVTSTGEEIDIPIWNYVTLSECKQIILNGKNWSLFFEDTFVRPEEAHMVGGKEPKTDWILRVNSILNMLSKERKLLGFMHDDEGHLIPDPRTRHLPKLIFYMYLYGYTTAQIAEALTFVGQRTYRGNIRWQPAVISYVLHNERYCGDVFTRKMYTQDVLTHRKLKNRGQRPRSRYLDTHEAIISRDDFIAVQHRLNNARFGSKSILPELMVIPQGLLRGFVIVNPRWGAFKVQDYRDASMSAYMNGEDNSDEVSIEFNAGDFDLRGFEIAHLDMTVVSSTPFVSFFDKKIKFGQECLNRMQTDGYVELLVHPGKQQFAVRRTTKDNRNAVVWASATSKRNQTRIIAATAFSDTLYTLFGWDRANK